MLEIIFMKKNEKVQFLLKSAGLVLIYTYKYTFDQIDCCQRDVVDTQFINFHLNKFLTTTMKTCQNSSNWCHFSIDIYHNELKWEI